MIEHEIFGFTVRGVPFLLFPGWLQLAIGSTIAIGFLVLVVAAYGLVPSALNRGVSDAAVDRLAAAGVLMMCAGVISVAISALVMGALA